MRTDVHANSLPGSNIIITCYMIVNENLYHLHSAYVGIDQYVYA